MSDSTPLSPSVDEPIEPLDEFCTGLSATVNSVELIAVFRYREIAAGRNHDTATAYRERFANVAAHPVT